MSRDGRRDEGRVNDQGRRSVGGRARKRRPRKSGGMSGLRRIADKHRDVPTNADEQPRRRKDRTPTPPRRSPVREASRSPDPSSRQNPARERSASPEGNRREEGERDESDDYTDEEDSPRDREGMLEQRDRLEDELEKVKHELKKKEKKRQDREQMAQDFTVDLRNRLLDHKKEWDKVGVELEDRQKERQKMEGESKEVEQELEDLRDRIEELEDDVDKINQYDLELDCKSVQSLEDLCTDADKDIQQITSQVKALKNKLEDLENTLDDEQDELDDVEDEKEAIRAEEDRIIEKCNHILKDYKEAFNLKEYAKEASSKGGSRSSGLGMNLFSRKRTAPMSNTKKDLCNRTISDVQSIMKRITKELHPNNMPKSNISREVNLELRSYIMHTLNQVGDSIQIFNEMLINKFNDLGLSESYMVMRYLAEELEHRNEKLMKEREGENLDTTCGQHKELEEELRQLRSERSFTEQCLETFRIQLNAYIDESSTNQKRLDKIHKKKKLLRELQMTKDDLLRDVREAEETEKTSQTRLKKSSAMVWDSYRGSQSHRNLGRSRSPSPAPGGGGGQRRRGGRTDDGSRKSGPGSRKHRADGTRMYSDQEISDSEEDSLNRDSVQHRERERTPRRTEPTRHPKRVRDDGNDYTPGRLTYNDRDISKSPPPPANKHRPSDSRYSFENDEEDEDVRNSRQRSQEGRPRSRKGSESPPRRIRGKEF